MWTLRRPSAELVRNFLERERRCSFSYPEVGATRGRMPAGYDVDRNRVRLGEGSAVFERAREALWRWEMFPPGWTRVEAHGPIEEGRTVLVLIRIFGLWWLNSARIVYVIDEPRRAGFAYGTLPAHVERGEECFSVEWLPDDSVWYDLCSFSRPRLWLARAARPLARSQQRRFVRESQAALRAALGREASAELRGVGP